MTVPFFARLALYFVIGGLIISLAVYLVSRGTGWLAGFITLMPSATLLTFLFTYLESGARGSASYARGLLLFAPAWIVYITTVLLTVEKVGIWRSLALGVTSFMLLALTTRLITRGWLD